MTTTASGLGFAGGGDGVLRAFDTEDRQGALDVPDRPPDRGRPVALLGRRQGVPRDHGRRHADLVGRRHGDRASGLRARRVHQAVAAAGAALDHPPARGGTDDRAADRARRRPVALARARRRAPRPPVDRPRRRTHPDRGRTRRAQLERRLVEHAERHRPRPARLEAGRGSPGQRRRLPASREDRQGRELRVPGRHHGGPPPRRDDRLRGQRDRERPRAEQGRARRARRDAGGLQRRLPARRTLHALGAEERHGPRPGARRVGRGRPAAVGLALHVPAHRHDHRQRGQAGPGRGRGHAHPGPRLLDVLDADRRAGPLHVLLRRLGRVGREPGRDERAGRGRRQHLRPPDRSERQLHGAEERDDGRSAAGLRHGPSGAEVLLVRGRRLRGPARRRLGRERSRQAGLRPLARRARQLLARPARLDARQDGALLGELPPALPDVPGGARRARSTSRTGRAPCCRACRWVSRPWRSHTDGRPAGSGTPVVRCGRSSS